MGRPKVVLKSRTKVQYGDQSFTKEECLNDLLKEQESVGDSPITRKRYRDNGNIPEVVYEALFGTFLEFRRAAGIIQTRAQQTLKSAIARSVATDNLRKVWIDRTSYGEMYRKDSGNRHRIIIGCNDLHDAECDPFMLRVMIDTIKRVKPDVIVSNGDHFDCPEFGKYPNDPREWDVAGRIKSGLEIFRQMREAAPDAEIDLIEGNHEARVIRFFTEVAPAAKALLADLHGMDMRKFFGLDRYEINYIAKTDMNGAYADAGIKKEVRRNYKTYYNSVCAHHFPAGRLLGIPGWNGHHHSHLVQHFYNSTYGPYEWHQFGSGHRRDATYTDGQKWANGFGIWHVDTQSRQALAEYVPVGMTMAVAAGKVYHRQPDEFYDALYPMTDSSRIVPFVDEKPKKK